MSEETKEKTSAEAEGGESRGGMRNVIRDKEAGMTPTEPRFKGRRRRKVSYLTINKIYTVDFKEINILRRFLNDRGKMLPSRQTGNTAKQQRMIARAIRKAREMALLPYVVTEFHESSRPPRPPRRDYNRDYNRDSGPREQSAPKEAPASEGE